MRPQFDPWCATFALLWYGPNDDAVHRIDAGRVERGLPSFLEAP